MEKEKRIRGLADTLLILLITIVTGTILIMACGADPAEAYSLFFRGIFGTPAAFAEIFVKACPLILTGLAVLWLTALDSLTLVQKASSM